MDEIQAKEEIQLIKTMLEKTKKATAESGTLFMVWGVLIALALVGNYILVYFKKYDWEWLNWVVATGIGWVYSVIYGIRKERREPVRTYVQTSARHLYFACGAGFLLVGIALPALGVYSYEAITILIAVVSGILFFVMGGIYEWPILRWFGLLWWMGALGMSFIKGVGNRTIIFTVLFVACYLVPSFILRSKYKKERTSK
jgi:hypothetical protein